MEWNLALCHNTFVSFSDCKLITVLSRKRSSLNCFSQVQLQRATVLTIRKYCFLCFHRDLITNLTKGVGGGERAEHPPYRLKGEQGWRSGESAHLPPMWPRFDSRSRRHMWAEFFVGSRPCSEGFSLGSPVFLPPQKSTFLNCNSIWKQWIKSHFVEIPLQILINFYFVYNTGSTQSYWVGRE